VPSDRFIVGHDFSSHLPYRGKQNLYENVDFIVIKRSRILRFKKYTYLSYKMNLSVLLRNKKVPKYQVYFLCILSQR
jgi:hypothetical protein